MSKNLHKQLADRRKLDLDKYDLITRNNPTIVNAGLNAATISSNGQPGADEFNASSGIAVCLNNGEQQ